MSNAQNTPEEINAAVWEEKEICKVASSPNLKSTGLQINPNLKSFQEFKCSIIHTSCKCSGMLRIHSDYKDLESLTDWGKTSSWNEIKWDGSIYSGLCHYSLKTSQYLPSIRSEHILGWVSIKWLEIANNIICNPMWLQPDKWSLTNDGRVVWL